MRSIKKLKEITSDYLEKYNIEMDVDDLFNQFQDFKELYLDFSRYLKDTGLNHKLNKMKRNKRLKEKRALFCKWFFVNHQNDKEKNVYDLLIEISEMVYLSERTVQSDIFGETTAQSCKNASQ